MEDLDTTTAAAPAKATVSRSTLALAMIGAAVFGSTLGTVSGWKLRGTHDAAISSATTTVHGMLQLPDGGYTSVGTVCSGSGGYNDLTAGTAVTIGDDAGKTLAVTSLQPGTFGGGGCQLTFSAKVPAATSYTVTISHRGTQVFPASAVAGGFNLTMNAG